jgi:hypothetical protein
MLQKQAEKRAQDEAAAEEKEKEARRLAEEDVARSMEKRRLMQEEARRKSAAAQVPASIVNIPAVNDQETQLQKTKKKAAEKRARKKAAAEEQAKTDRGVCEQQADHKTIAAQVPAPVINQQVVNVQRPHQVGANQLLMQERDDHLRAAQQMNQYIMSEHNLKQQGIELINNTAMFFSQATGIPYVAEVGIAYRPAQSVPDLNIQVMSQPSVIPYAPMQALMHNQQMPFIYSVPVQTTQAPEGTMTYERKS